MRIESIAPSCSSVEPGRLTKTGPHGFEFCRINYENFNGREHRYIWGNGFGTMIPDKIMKVDAHIQKNEKYGKKR